MKVKKLDKEFIVTDKKLNKEFWEVHYNNWENNTFEFIKQHLDEKKVFLDIGSWVGPISIPVSYYSRKCICFEPDTDAFNELAENIKLNNIENIVINKLAVSTNKKLNIGNKVLGQSGTSFLNPENSIECDCISVKDIFKKYKLTNNNVSVLKLDIEGHEINLFNDEYFCNLNVPMHISLHPGLFFGEERIRYNKVVTEFFNNKGIDISKHKDKNFYEITIEKK